MSVASETSLTKFMTPKKVGYTVLLCFLLAVFFVGNFPLAAVLSWANLREQGLNWQKIEGTVWDGQIFGLTYKDYPIGTTSIQLSFLPFLQGKMTALVAVRGHALNADGSIIIRGGNNIQIKDLSAIADLSRYNIRDIFQTKMNGSLRLEVVQLQVVDQVCQTAIFSLWTDTLIYSARHYGGEGFALSGDGTCEQGMLILPLEGSGTRETVSLEAVLQPDMNYTARVLVRSQTPDLREILRLFGFEKRQDQLVLVQRGNLLAGVVQQEKSE